MRCRNDHVVSPASGTTRNTASVTSACRYGPMREQLHPSRALIHRFAVLMHG